MKRQFILGSLILFLILCSFTPICRSQSANTAEPKSQSAEPIGENDRLPFMQSEETSESREPSSSGLLLKTLGAMLLVVGLIFAGAWVAKKAGFGGGKSNGLPDELGLAILSSVSLGNGRTISTVRFGERVLLVGLTSQTFTLLAEEKPDKELSMHNSRSVAEMLAEETDGFGQEFDNARTRLGIWEDMEEVI